MEKQNAFSYNPLLINQDRPEDFRFARCEELLKQDMKLRIRRLEKKATINPQDSSSDAREAYLEVASNFVEKFSREKTKLLMPPSAWADLRTRLATSPVDLARLIVVEQQKTPAHWQETLITYVISKLEETLCCVFRVSNVRALSRKNASAAISRAWTLTDCQAHKFDPLFMSQLRWDYDFCFPPDTNAQVAIKASDTRWALHFMNMLPEVLADRIRTYNLETPGADEQAFSTLLQSQHIRAFNLLDHWSQQFSHQVPPAPPVQQQRRNGPRRPTAHVAAVSPAPAAIVTPPAQVAQVAQSTIPATTRLFCSCCNTAGHIKDHCPAYFCHGCNTRNPQHHWKRCPQSPYPRKADGTEVDPGTGRPKV